MDWISDSLESRESASDCPRRPNGNSRAVLGLLASRSKNLEDDIIVHLIKAEELRVLVCTFMRPQVESSGHLGTRQVILNFPQTTTSPEDHYLLGPSKSNHQFRGSRGTSVIDLLQVHRKGSSGSLPCDPKSRSPLNFRAHIFSRL